MEVLRHSQPIGRLSHTFAKLYAAMSEKKMDLSGLSVPKCWYEYLNLYPLHAHPQYIELDMGHYPTPESNGLMLAFSGGKDSVFAATVAMERGYAVTLYHIRGLNKSYPNEWEHAVAIAEYLRLPIIVEQISRTGHSDFWDNPVKNQYVISRMVELGGVRRITNFAMGNYPLEKFAALNLKSNGSDGEECFLYSTPIYQYVMPAYKYVWLLKTDRAESLTGLSRDMKLFGMTLSCIAPNRFRKVYREQNLAKYGPGLLPENRCGSCTKCAFEYILLATLNRLPYSRAFMLKCFKFMRDNVADELLVKNPEKLTNSELLGLYVPTFETIDNERQSMGLPAVGIQVYDDLPKYGL